MSSNEGLDAETVTVEAEQKSAVGHIVDLLIAFRWPIAVALLLLVAGVVFVIVEIEAVPVIALRILALGCLIGFVTLAWVGPILLLSFLWVTMRSATPILIGDEDHKEVHCELRKDLSDVRFSEGLPRQRASDLGAAYIVLEGDPDPEGDADAVYNTPLTEQQPSWFQLVESPAYKEWKKTRVDLTEPLREAVEQKQELYADYLERLRTQCNRLIVGVQEDLDISDVDELEDDDWSGIDELEPEGPDRTDGRMDSEMLDLIERSKERRGVADDD